MDFQIGDKVIHRDFGLGELVRLDEIMIKGRQSRCYVVQVRDLTLWVPINEVDGSSLRLPTPKSEFGQCLEILHTPGDPLPEDRMGRRALLLDQLKDGTLTSVCRVVRDLSTSCRVKPLNDHEKSILERAKDLLITEWTFSLSIPPNQAQKELMQLLAN